MSTYGYLVLAFVLLFSMLTLNAQADSQVLAPPFFSHKSGFYLEEFDLSLSHPDPEVQIYYTLDGSDPDPENLTGTSFRYKNEYAQPPATEPIGQFFYQKYQTYLYTQSIPIVDRTFEPDRMSQISTTFDEKPNYFPKPEPKKTWLNTLINRTNALIHHLNRALNRLVFHYYKYALQERQPKGDKEYIPSLPLFLKNPLEYLFKGTPVRGMAVSAVHGRSPIVSQVFFIGDQYQFSLPIINITVPEKDLFDYDQGIFVAGKKFDDWIISGQADPKLWAGAWPVNWNERQDRQVFLSIFDHNRKFEQMVDIRTHGSGSRRQAMKSIRLQPRKKWHPQGLEFDLFADAQNLGLARVNLRNAGQEYHSTYFTDAANHQIMQGLSFGTQRYRPYLVFINAEFYALLNARDRNDQHYIQQHFALPSKDLDYIKADSIHKLVVKRGDLQGWQDFLDGLRNQDSSSALFYKQVDQEICLESFMDYHIAEIFIAHTDWPYNNLGFWRYKGSPKHPRTADGYTDGRWRWLFFDTDALGHWLGARRDKKKAPKHNTLTWATDEKRENTYLLRTLLTNPQFKQEFILRFADLLNSWFQPARTKSIVRHLETNLAKEMPRHIARWSAPRTMDHWHQAVDDLVYFFEHRPDFQWQHLQEFFDLQGVYTLNLDVHGPGTGQVRVNTLSIGHDPDEDYELTDTSLFFPWSGQYFKNLPLTLEARPAPGYVFSHWQGTGLSTQESRQPILKLKPDTHLQVLAVMVPKNNEHDHVE